MTILKTLLISSLLIGLSVQADEMDEVKAPTGIMVKMDHESGSVEYFEAKSFDMRGLDSDVEALRAIERFESEKNLTEENVTTVEDADEMDQEPSTKAWYWYSWGNYSRWNRWGGYHRNYFRWNHYRYHYNYSYRHYRYSYYYYW